jgi:hypothetical protein
MLAWDEVQGARNAKTGMYMLVHEDFEYRATQQFALAIIWDIQCYLFE